MSEDSNPRTLYVGNLDSSVCEDLLCALFSQFGPVEGCKIIRVPGSDPYAFLEFTNHQGASTALGAMNERVFLEKEMKVNWATRLSKQLKQDTSNPYHIYVGGLSPKIETQILRKAFAPFGDISNCRIVRDPQTLESKGYAFISFVKKAEAENAITAMNGQRLGSRRIRTKWSTGITPPPRRERPRNPNAKNLTYEEVYSQSSPTNCTVFCGGFVNEISEELMQKTFSPFGTIQNIRVFKDKGYAFIRFTTKDSAARAIEAIHNTEINGQPVKCFWSMESVGPNNAQNISKTSDGTEYPYGYGQQMSYWYPPSYTTASTSAAPQMQSQYLQGYPYSQFGYQQNYMGRVGMPMSSWQGMPGSQKQVSGTSQQMAAAAQGAAIQQTGDGIMAYAMEQFPTQ